MQNPTRSPASVPPGASEFVEGYLNGSVRYARYAKWASSSKKASARVLVMRADLSPNM